mmetsp:Transcript_25843/g.65376  ORF Transcript_25843/g.65376 Transcript_25843/m.65376 type:complete len:103 (+) Transcript_25843:2932-3240(+)
MGRSKNGIRHHTKREKKKEKWKKHSEYQRLCGAINTFLPLQIPGVTGHIEAKEKKKTSLSLKGCRDTSTLIQKHNKYRSFERGTNSTFIPKRYRTHSFGWKS